mmetsp:Transcript_92087/g.263886  ORF Transcript_92087/g.263886 Transcript_92087/m.263886 type:complete len:272 (+) Transcript_92087:1191-2006(+)
MPLARLGPFRHRLRNCGRLRAISFFQQSAQAHATPHGRLRRRLDPCPPRAGQRGAARRAPPAAGRRCRRGGGGGAAAAGAGMLEARSLGSCPAGAAPRGQGPPGREFVHCRAGRSAQAATPCGLQPPALRALQPRSAAPRNKGQAHGPVMEEGLLPTKASTLRRLQLAAQRIEKGLSSPLPRILDEAVPSAQGSRQHPLTRKVLQQPPHGAPAARGLQPEVVHKPARVDLSCLSFTNGYFRRHGARKKFQRRPSSMCVRRPTGVRCGFCAA